MQVKAIASILAVALLALAGCPASRAPLRARVESAVIAAGRPVGPVSLLAGGGSLFAVFSDWETTSLAVCEVPIGPRLPPSIASPRLIDKVDVAPPLSPSFGEHACAASSGSLAVLYLDREREDKSVLKLATRAVGASSASSTSSAVQWRLDILEPAGGPLALLVEPDGRMACFWAAGSVFFRDASGAQGILRDALQPGSRALGFAAGDTRGFTVFDQSTRQLVWYRWTGGELAHGVVAEAGPVHAPTMSVDEAGVVRLAVASYDPSKRRIYFFRETDETGSFSRITVTMADGTRSLFCAPWNGGFLFLYDETRPLGGGKSACDLSLLAPVGARYQKVALSTGSAPLLDLSAVLLDGALYVLALRQELALLRVEL
jgi:hypothetical protein